MSNRRPTFFVEVKLALELEKSRVEVRMRTSFQNMIVSLMLSCCVHRQSASQHHRHTLDVRITYFNAQDMGSRLLVETSFSLIHTSLIPSS